MTLESSKIIIYPYTIINPEVLYLTLHKMLNIMKVDKKSLIRWKVYLDRSKMYIGYVNLLMMVTIFLGAIKNTEVGMFLLKNVYVTIPVLIVVFVFFALLLGYWDSRLGIRSEEMRNLSLQNPVQKEILQTVRELKNNQEVLLKKINELGNIK